VLGISLILHIISKNCSFMSFAASVCAAACVWPEGEQATALNEATIWYEECLIISGVCKGTGYCC